MRDMRKGVCALCEHTEIVVAAAKETAGPVFVPLAVASRQGWLGREPVGAFTTYTCRSCGYTQWFASKPSEIPIDEDKWGTVLHRAKPPAGYR